MLTCLCLLARRCPPRALLLVLLLAAACDGQSPEPTQHDDLSQTYWALRLNHHAALLSTTAPYNTLTVVATPENVEGEALVGLGTPQYESSNPDLVRITADGVVHAVRVGTQVVVRATLTAGNLTYRDTMFVTVVDNTAPPTLVSFSVHPLPPDSAKIAINSPVNLILPVRALGADEQPFIVVSGEADTIPLPVSFRSADPTMVAIEPLNGRILHLQNNRRGKLGVATVYASTVAFGVVKADTVAVEMGLPLFTSVTVTRAKATPGGALVNVFRPSEVYVGVGATVVWHSDLETATDIVFDDPSQAGPASLESPFARDFIFACHPMGLAYDCGGGNVAPFVKRVEPTFGLTSNGAGRTFSTAGTYGYHNTLHGTGGRIVVVDEQ